MAYLHSSGAISFSQLQSHFGGGNPISMSEYYRNGSYVPSIYTETTTTTTTQGPTYTSTTKWYVLGASSYLTWSGSNKGTISSTALSHTTGGWTYYRDSYDSTDGYGSNYKIRRSQSSSSTTTTNINTGIPSSGTISMNQFYGGRN